ncbi:MAG: ATP-dependent Clp protease ATP-binding subunit, partial [Candidatus Dadabacteria bacterium]
EIEKAHPLLVNLFLQVFDEGWLTDGRGKKVWFSDTIIIMTSNLGSEQFSRTLTPLGFARENQPFTQVQQQVEKVAEQRFSPEFLNRIDEIIVFQPLGQAQVREITRRYLTALEQHIAGLGKLLLVDEAAIDRLAEIGFSAKYGARFLKRRIDQEVKIPITMHWEEADQFRVTTDGERLIVEPAVSSMPVII